MPFEKHPDMRLHLDDFAMFVANWNDKATNLRAIAAGLDLALDSLVMVDDNPAERALIRELLPEVDVIELPRTRQAMRGQWRTIPGWKTVTLSNEDAHRTEQYQARREAAQLASAAGSLEEFHRGLEMAAWVGPFDEFPASPDRPADRQDQPVQPDGMATRLGGADGVDPRPGLYPPRPPSARSFR